jgi:hypothetical protein
VTAGIAIVLAAVHILLTAVFNLPYQSLKYGPLPGELADSYINPYLSQDYRIFAPDPANADRNLWVRAWVATPDGERVVSQWVDTTAVELAEPYRRVLRKQLTVLGAERLMGAYRSLTDAQRTVAAGNFHNAEDLTALLDALRGTGEDNVAGVNDFVRATNYVTSYGSQVALAMWGDEGEILAIQTRSVYSPVVRWGDRHDESAVAPPDTYTDLGWRPVMEWPEQDRDAFARTFLAWAEDAGLSLDLEPREPTTVDELPAGDIDAAQSDDVTAPATSGADDD